MASRRMLSIEFFESDRILSLTDKEFRLYTLLNLAADDDGLTSAIRLTLIKCGADDAILESLMDKGLILRLSESVVCVADWHLHNLIRADRYKPTNHTEEFKRLSLENTRYRIKGIPTDNQRSTDVIPTVDAGKDSLGQLRKGQPSSGKGVTGETSETADNALLNEIQTYIKSLINGKDYDKVTLEQAIKYSYQDALNGENWKNRILGYL